MAPPSISRLAQYPVGSFVLLLAGSLLLFMPFLIAVGPTRWFAIGPLAIQGSRIGLYAAYFTAGVALGHGGLQAVVPFARAMASRWAAWVLLAAATGTVFIAVASAIAGGDVVLRPTGALAVVGTMQSAFCAAACFALPALFVRFGGGSSPAWESLAANCPPSALLRQIEGLHERRMWVIVAPRSEDETDVGPARKPAEAVIKDIRRPRAAVLGRGEDPHRAGRAAGEDSIARLCRREGIASSMYSGWSRSSWSRQEAAGRRHGPCRDRDEVQDLRREAGALKEVVADLVLENRLLKKSMTGLGRRGMRYPASEKLEIIRLVEQSTSAGARHPGQASASPGRRFYRWYDAFQRGGLEALADRPSRPAGSGTGCRRRFAIRSSLSHWWSQSSAHAIWRVRFTDERRYSSRKRPSTACSRHRT